MRWVGFEPTIPAFERVKTVHASDRAAIVIGDQSYTVRFYNRHGKYVQFLAIIPDTNIYSLAQTCIIISRHSEWNTHINQSDV
jgi:hypothetical protein